VQWGTIIFLVLLGGVFSGLSLGLMQMDPTRLKIVMKVCTPLFPAHWLLSFARVYTLFISNPFFDAPTPR
jgi:hypothetical protein